MKKHRSLVYGLIICLVVNMFPTGVFAADQHGMIPDEMGEIPLDNYFISVTDIRYLDQMPKITVTVADTGEIVDTSEYRVSYVEQLITGEYRRVDGVPKNIGTYGIVIGDQPGGTYAIESNFDDEFSVFLKEEAIFSIEKLTIDGTEEISVLFDGKNEIEFDGSSMEIPTATVLLAGKELPRDEYDISFWDGENNQVSVIDHVGQYKAVVVDNNRGDNDNMEILGGVNLVGEFSVVDRVANSEPEGENIPVVPPTPTPTPTPMPDPLPDVPDVPNIPNVPEVNPDNVENPGELEKPEIKPEDDGEENKPEVEENKPEKPDINVPAAPKKIKITTDYGIIGVEISQPAKNIYGYRLAMCQKGKDWRYVNLKKNKYLVKRLDKKPLVKNGVYRIKVAVIGKDKVVGKYSEPITVYANLKGNCSVPMERAKLIKVTSKNKAVTVIAKQAMKNAKVKTFYRFAWREKNSEKWHYSKVANKRIHKFVGLKKGKSYIMSLRYCYVSPVDGKTKVWSQYSRRLVRVR